MHGDVENYGGEGGIRTPDSLTTMPDFESGAFNRALPPLRLCLQQLASLLHCSISGYDLNYDVSGFSHP